MSTAAVQRLLERWERIDAIPIGSEAFMFSIRDIVADLRGAVDVPEVPQVIRTLEELEELDPDAVIAGVAGNYFAAWKIQDLGDLENLYYPLLVVVPGPQVRAAQKALEEAE